MRVRNLSRAPQLSNTGTRHDQIQFEDGNGAMTVTTELNSTQSKPIWLAQLCQVEFSTKSHF
jgi:hypothetical protein